MFYIGQTERIFITRVKEHKRCGRNGDETSLLAKHVRQLSHSCIFHPEILRVPNEGTKLDAIEQFKTAQRDMNMLMYEQVFTTHSPILKIPFPKTNSQIPLVV
jgi:hypothetical protein